MILDIHNRKDILDRLQQLKEDSTPEWGQMSPQHIVEHLAMVLTISTDKNPQELRNTPEVAEGIKQKMIYSADEMPQGIKSPVLGDTPPPLRHTDMRSAVEELMNELDYFDTYYAANPGKIHTQPRMGDLNYNEWTTLHNKHFTHHFKQYRLI